MNAGSFLGFSLLSLFFLLPSPCFSADEESDRGLPSKSPDGKWLVRMPNEAEREKLKKYEVPKAGLFELPSGRRVAYPFLDSMDAFVGSVEVVWAKDSTRVAFNHREGTRYYTSDLCELKDGKITSLPSPEDMLFDILQQQKAAKIKEMGLKPTVYRRRIHDEMTALRWIDANTIEIVAHSKSTVPVKANEKDDDPEIVDVEAWFQFTLKLDAKKKEWKILKSEKLKNE